MTVLDRKPCYRRPVLKEERLYLTLRQIEIHNEHCKSRLVLISPLSKCKTQLLFLFWISSRLYSIGFRKSYAQVNK